MIVHPTGVPDTARIVAVDGEPAGPALAARHAPGFERLQPRAPLRSQALQGRSRRWTLPAGRADEQASGRSTIDRGGAYRGSLESMSAMSESRSGWRSRPRHSALSGLN